MAGPNTQRIDDLQQLAKDWKKSFKGPGRSKTLKALDKALAEFADFPQNLGAVEEAFNAWKDSKADWEESKRMKDKDMKVQRLNAILSPFGDTDKMFGTADVLTANTIHARQGVLFLFGHLDVSTNWAKLLLNGGLTLAASGTSFAGGDGLGVHGLKADAAAGLAGNLIGQGRILFDPLADQGIDSYGSKGVADATTLKARIRGFFEDFVKNMKEKLFEKFGIVDLAFSALNNLITQLVAQLAAKAAPFLSGGKDVVKGITRTVDQGMKVFKVWQAKQGVVLAKGHPTAVVSAIELHMKASLGEGLWEVLRGASSMGLSVVAGASVIFDLVVAGLEMLVKYAWHFCESMRLKAFCREAGEQWGMDKGESFAAKPYAFHAWFRKAALTIPTIPALTLNSGYCGDKTIWLQMFNDGASGISRIEQDQFDKGVNLLDSRLKPYAASYLKKVSFDLGSSSKQIEVAIERSKNITSPDRQHVAWRLWKGFLGVESFGG